MIIKKLILFYITAFIVCSHSIGQLYINEFSASNGSIVTDPDYSTFCDWIEIYNSDTVTINLNGYHLTDDLANPYKWAFPDVNISAGGFFIVWADGMATSSHSSFKLSNEGEQIALFAPDTILIDSITFGLQVSDISFGRHQDGNVEFVYFADPTPGSSNTTIGSHNFTRADPPVFSIESGFYSAGQIVEISMPSSSGYLQITTNSSTPNASTSKYYSDTNIEILSNLIIRARFVDTLNLLTSKIVTNSYFTDPLSTLPVISIVTDSVNLWDDQKGIYCIGTNGITKYGVTANYWQDWERPISFEFLKDGISVDKLYAGISLNGERRNMGQKSLRILARGKYGSETFNYKYFNNCDIERFSSLVLRNGGDYSYSHLRDGIIQTIGVQELDVDQQGYQPANVYINGAYWGIYNIREKQNEDYIAAHHNVDPGNIDLLQFNAEIIQGDNSHYLALLDYLENSDLSAGSSYDYVKTQVDIDEYMNYMMLQIYVNNLDWPGNNIKYWRPRTAFGKWRWLLFDTDAGLGCWGSYDFDMLQHVTEFDSPDWSNPPWATFLFRKMIEIPEFRNTFMQRFSCYMNTGLSTENFLHVIDSLQGNIEAEMPRHIETWKDVYSTDGICVQSMQDWYNNVDVMREFVRKRAYFMREDIMETYGFTDTLLLTTISVNGKIKIFDYTLEEGQNRGRYFSDIPIAIQAIPDIGYQFVKWQNGSESSSPELNITLSDDMILVAMFAPSNESIIPTFIGSNTTLLAANSPYIGYGDIIVDSNTTLTIEPGVEIKMAESANFIVYGQLKLLGSEESPVLISANNASGAENWGAICLYNSTDTTYLLNTELTNCTHGRDEVNFKAAVSAYNSDIVMDGVSIRDARQTFLSQFGNHIEIRNCTFRSTESGDLINIKYAQYAITENCDLKGNDAPDMDAIDYDQISGGIIRGNKIYGFYGTNCDGIDIGEQGSDILITDNIITNCTDKGISVGQSSTVIIARNLITNCYYGVGVKDSLSFAYVDQNTFYNNSYAVGSFEKNIGAGGGTVHVVNSILSANKIASFYVDDLSEVIIRYSISDTDTLDGSTNLFGNPMFVDNLTSNFELQPNSPCIDSGDPLSPYDDDESYADMGAYFVFNPTAEQSLVINEINYHSPLEAAADDWLELYNSGDEAIDISGWVIRDGNDQTGFVFPEGMVIGSGGYLVVVQDELKFSEVHPDVAFFLPVLGFGLSNGGELVRLFDGQMNIADIVEYDDIEPWPILADGFGPSLELRSANLDNSLATSWQASNISYGTPGTSNSVVGQDEIVAEKELLLTYPNPTDGMLRVAARNISGKKLKMDVRNIFGQGVYSWSFDLNGGNMGTIIDLSNLNKGIYILVIETEEGYQESQKIILQ